MPQPTAGSTAPISDEERGLGPAARGLPPGREPASRGRVMDEPARAAAKSDSSAALARLNQSLDAERAAAKERLLARDESVGLGKRDAFPTLSDADKAKLAPSGPPTLQLLGPGLPLPPAPTGNGDLKAIEAFRKQLPEATGERRGGRSPAPSLASSLRSSQPPGTAAEPAPVPQPPGPVDLARPASLAAALHVLETHTVGQLRAIAGDTFPQAWRGKEGEPLSNVVSEIIYVGPSFFGVFDAKGELAPTPVGSVGRLLSVAAPETNTGGTYLTYGVIRDEDVYQKPHVIQLNGNPRGRTFGQWGINVESTFGQRRQLIEWSNTGRARVFVISPSYWHRKGVGAALHDAPGRLKRAAEIGAERGYFQRAMKDAARNLSWKDVAMIAGQMLVEHYLRIPIVTPDDLEDAHRLGSALGMAIWGTDANADQDLDVAARMLAPEVAGMLVSGVAANVLGAMGRGGRAIVPPKRGADPGTPGGGSGVYPRIAQAPVTDPTATSGAASALRPPVATPPVSVPPAAIVPVVTPQGTERRGISEPLTHVTSQAVTPALPPRTEGATADASAAPERPAPTDRPATEAAPSAANRVATDAHPSTSTVRVPTTQEVIVDTQMGRRRPRNDESADLWTRPVAANANVETHVEHAIEIDIIEVKEAVGSVGPVVTSGPRRGSRTSTSASVTRPATTGSVRGESTGGGGGTGRGRGQAPPQTPADPTRRPEHDRGTDATGASRPRVGVGLVPPTDKAMKHLDKAFGLTHLANEVKKLGQMSGVTVEVVLATTASGERVLVAGINSGPGARGGFNDAQKAKLKELGINDATQHAQGMEGSPHAEENIGAFLAANGLRGERWSRAVVGEAKPGRIRSYVCDACQGMIRLSGGYIEPVHVLPKRGR